MREPIQCAKCRFLSDNNISMTCEAFQKGIPWVMLSGEFIHDKIHPKQKNDIIFEKLKE